MPIATSLFDYPLPASAIAQHPKDKRDASRLMVVRRMTKTVEHRHFFELPEILSSLNNKIIFFRNNARVIKARLFLNRQSGGAIELLLLRPAVNYKSWWCLAKPLKKITVGEALLVAGKPTAILREKSEMGEALFEFSEDPLELSERIGALPLPPYIVRCAHDKNEADDLIRYQTVYAKERVAAAAPTAGLHFTPELIAKLEGLGHRFADLTLHVGLDTFRPISAPTVEEHKIHTEAYTISQETAKLLENRKLKAESRLFVAVGTTSLRTMEDFVRKGCPVELSQSASLFIYPPQVIQSADALITNFHLPKSTLMCLVSAFLTPGSLEGIGWLKGLYAEALAKGYRFYSYGDAMVIL